MRAFIAAPSNLRMRKLASAVYGNHDTWHHVITPMLPPRDLALPQSADEHTVAQPLHAAVGRGGFFTLAFGAIVGSGWVVVLGEWLGAAGPIGTIAAIGVGGLVMALVASCYGELAARFTAAGGEFLYTFETFGPFAGFLAGWFLTLYAVAACAFEAVALAWMLRNLLPVIALPTAYSMNGAPVSWDALMIGLLGTLGVGALHLRGASSAIRFQNIVTFGFIAVVTGLIACGFSLGSTSNWRPLFAPNPAAAQLAGVLWVFSTCAFFLNGWQAGIHALAERKSNVSPRSAISCIVIAIAVAALFYACIVLASSSAIPWQRLVGVDLPGAFAFGQFRYGTLLRTALLSAAVISLTKTWVALAWIASRLLFAQARGNLLPRSLAAIDPRSGTPRVAVLLVTLLTLLGVAAGRGAILALVSMISVCLALSIILCLFALIRRRRLDGEALGGSSRVSRVTIGAALSGAFLMVGAAVVEPFWRGDGRIPREWYWLAGWALIGIITWISTRSMRRAHARITP
jgi:APA family basic amino acid/polyamine antiporter